MARQPATTSANRRRQTDWWAIALLALTILFVVVVRCRIIDTPLERDEGEYAYGGQLICHGEVPYRFLYNIKLPGTYGAYAVIMTLFGETPTGIHLGLLLVNVASICLVFVIGKKLHSAAVGVLAGALFSVMALSPDVLGFAAHATHFVMVCALAGIYFLLRTIERGRLTDALCSGVLMGASFLCKQPGLLFGVMGFVVLFAILTTRKAALLGSYFSGWIAPFLLLCLAMLLTGDFHLFWRWTVTYAIGHALPLSGAVASFKQTWNELLPQTHILYWLAPIACLYVALRKSIARSTRFVVIAFVVVAFAAIVPGFYFYHHYFVMTAPAVALCVAVALVEGARQCKQRAAVRWVAWIVLVAGPLWIGWMIFVSAIYLFKAPPELIISRTYAGNPFLQTQVIGKYLAEHCSPDGRIAVLESEPETLFYARRKSATGYIYAYDMTSASPYRAEMVTQFQNELIASKPEYVVLVNNGFSWTIADKAGEELMQWCWQFARSSYQLVGVADGVNDSIDETIFKWDADALTYTNRSENYIEVYRRSAP